MASNFAVASLNSLSADMKATLENIPGDLLIRCESQEESPQQHLVHLLLERFSSHNSLKNVPLRSTLTLHYIKSHRHGVFGGKVISCVVNFLLGNKLFIS